MTPIDRHFMLQKRPILILFFFSLILRAYAAFHGHPFSYHSDEHWIFKPAFRMVMEHSWDPNWFSIPPFLTMIYRIALTIYEWFFTINLNIPAAQWLNPGFILPHQFPALYLGRFIIALFGSGTVVLIYLILKRWVQNSFAFFFAFLYSITNLNIQYSSFLRPEPLIMFFCVLSIYFLCRFQSDNQKKWIWFAGLSIGFSAGAKYNGGFFILTAFLFLWLLHLSRKETFYLYLQLSLGSVAGLLIAIPQLLWKPSHVINDLIGSYHVYTVGHIGNTGTHYRNFFTYLKDFYPLNRLSILFFATGLSVIIYPLVWNKVKKETKPFIIACIFFSFSYIIFICQFNYIAERNSVIINPFLFLSAAMIFNYFFSLPGKIAKLIIIGILIATTSITTIYSIADLSKYNKPLPQDIATNWFHKNAPEKSKVLKEFETPLINPQKYQVIYMHSVAFFKPEFLLYLNPNYLILSENIHNMLGEVQNDYVKKFNQWIWAKKPDFEDSNAQNILFGLGIRIYDFQKYKNEFVTKFGDFLTKPDQAKPK